MYKIHKLIRYNQILKKLYRGTIFPKGYYNEFEIQSDDSTKTIMFDFGNGETHRLCFRRQFQGQIWGLFLSGGPAKANTFLGDYVGETINHTEFVKRMLVSGDKYVAELIPNKLWLCARDKGNCLRWMNHHCTKHNCKMLRYKKLDGTSAIGLWTKKYIKDGEDLFFHYGKQDDLEVGMSISCLCKGRDNNGHPICKYRM